MDVHSSTAWQRSRTPCGFFYNTGWCPKGDACSKSHSQRDVAVWQRSRSGQLCAFGRNCSYYEKNSCIFYHPHVRPLPLTSERSPPRHTPDTYAVERGLSMVKGLTGAIDLGDPDDSPGIDDLLAAPLAIQNERVLATYNKISDNKIAVPGCPPQFAPPTSNMNLCRDSDCNPVGLPFPEYTHVLEPLVRSVQCMAPGLDVLASCDVAANAGSIYRLFNFLRGELLVSMRADIEWRGGADGTLMMQPWNDDPDHEVSYGYGKGFSDKTCRYPDGLPQALKTSFTHHRVLHYHLGPLRFVLHCEVDGFHKPEPRQPPLPDASESWSLSAASRPAPALSPYQMPVTPPVSPKIQGASIHGARTAGGLTAAVPPRTRQSAKTAAGFGFGLSPPRSPSSKGSRFSVLAMEGDDGEEDEEDEDGQGEEESGTTAPHRVQSDTLAIDYPCGPARDRAIPADQLVEIKTFSMSKKAFKRQMPEPQLYFGRCHKLYEAGHLNGFFAVDGLQIRDMTVPLQELERRHQRDLARLIAFLQQLRTLAFASAVQGRTRLSLVLPVVDKKPGRATLYVRPADEPSFLPEDL